MNFPFYIARRYLVSTSKNNAINIITRIAAIGIVIGAMALFVVLSVFSGLKVFSLSFSNDFDPDLKVMPASGKSMLLSDIQKQQIAQIQGVAATSQVIEERVLFLFNGKEKVAYMKGVDSLFNSVNDIKKTLFNGQWIEPGTYQAVLGYGIANNLSIGLFDYTNPLEVYVPKPGRGTINSPENAFNRGNLLPIGIYAISEELDAKYVFVDLGLAQEMLQYKPSQITSLEVKMRPDANETQIISELHSIFQNKIIVKNRAQLNDSLYKMLNTENLVVYLIFTLVIIVALFNLIGALIMMILDKKSNLKTMLSLGAGVRDLRKIFMLQGTLLSVTGGLLGLFLGTGVILIQQHFQFIMITNDLAYPVEFRIENILIVFATIVVLGILSSYIAASRINAKLLS
ncbi:MAG: ABC transporter permease [Flavobacterium sp.]|nr:ABC transporter permease [Flavobacterium sp.]